eukprot:CAMPEP_0113504270 /NCGR_PEP_ID=MMETSP0014_2-20120614/34624_1 /TAXON_ID=2857 /ORGANISM="Nitzschia sp." /LENGTH=498 /DNA_ID=CAMNT_0000399365 /DNA_START=277 /DNA_END=1769 /DNA_ORIENTATION=+ /assembly_acc=CAM_ASM_000159
MMSMIQLLGSCCCFLCLLTVPITASEDVIVKLRNDSGEFISVHWVHPQTKEPTLLSQIPPNQTSTLNSFYNHQFQIHQEPDKETGLCGADSEKKEENGECKINYFNVERRPQQLTVIKKGIKIEIDELAEPENDDVTALVDALKNLNLGGGNKQVQDTIEALVKLKVLDMTNLEDPVDAIVDCKSKAIKMMERLQGDKEKYNTVGDEDVTKSVMDLLRDCTVNKITPQLKRLTDEISFERELRVNSAHKMENFTCIDPDIELSTPIRDEEWTIEEVLRTKPEESPEPSQVSRTVHIMHDRPASQIHVVENFASEEECAAMEADAAPKLHVASTADGKGGTKISVGRKAMQAGIHPKFNADGTPKDGNLIAQLSGRVYKYVNHVLDHGPDSLDISHIGQEPLMSIQYFGRGRNDTEPDRYTPHCDGKCDDRQHDVGSRMATMVIYCDVADEGGNTNFNQANVHVKANKGSAIFFSYMNPIEKIMDYGFTTHSGCPVFSG